MAKGSEEEERRRRREGLKQDVPLSCTVLPVQSVTDGQKGLRANTCSHQSLSLSLTLFIARQPKRQLQNDIARASQDISLFLIVASDLKESCFRSNLCSNGSLSNSNQKMSNKKHFFLRLLPS
jgi:hypothetical protein